MGAQASGAVGVLGGGKGAYFIARVGAKPNAHIVFMSITKMTVLTMWLQRKKAPGALPVLSSAGLPCTALLLLLVATSSSNCWLAIALAATKKEGLVWPKARAIWRSPEGGGLPPDWTTNQTTDPARPDRRVSQFAGDKCGETRGESGRRFCHRAKVVQTRGRVGFPGPMGTWFCFVLFWFTDSGGLWWTSPY